MDIIARRNAFGRQVRSFEADLEVAGVAGGPVRAVFIRAPWIEDCGPCVEVLATYQSRLWPRARAACSSPRSTPSSQTTPVCTSSSST